MKEILEHIKRKRKELKITQEDIAGQLGMSKANYSNIESGTTRMYADTMIQIYQILKIQAIIFKSSEI